jgi:tight adherence protein E
MQVPKRRFNQASKQKQKGVVAIEFALGFMAFWMMCMAWVEMSYMSYVSAICDVTISQAARAAKKVDLSAAASGSTTTYLSTFSDVINNSESVWAGVIDRTKFTTKVHYLSSVGDLGKVKKLCIIEDENLPEDENATEDCGSADGSAIAIYSISYDFDSIFSFFIDNTTFTREVIVIQEYEL